MSTWALRQLLLTGIILKFLSIPVHADEIQNCAEKLTRSFTVKQYITKALSKIDDVRQREPAPQFVSRSRETFERFGERGPLAFDALMPAGTSYLSTPDPNAEHSVVAHRLTPGSAGALRITAPHPRNPNKKTTTFVYYYNFNLPNGRNPKGYLVDERIPSVFYHIHGGGTPSAVAMNASDTANWMIRHGYPVIAVTQPGHGDATRASMTPDEQEDWNLQILSQLVDPKVKVIMSGHSWGGQILLRAHRHSHLPKYKQVAGFVLGAPPIDITLGKGVEERLSAEDRLNEKMERIARGEVSDSEGLLARSSKDDMTFVANLVINGKLNPVGTWATTMTSLHYSTSILPKEQREKLKPACVFMGRNDALCYVGREKPALEYFRRMIGLENVTLFGKGKTFKGRQEQTGHQFMDNMLRLPDGTEVHEAYYRMAQFANDKAGAPPFVLSTDSVKGGSRANAESLIRHAWLLYQNNLAFRDYLAEGRSVIKYETGRVHYLIAPAERQKDALKKYHALKSNLERKIKEDLEAFARTEYKNQGIMVHTEFSNDALWGGFKSAQRELTVDFSAERKAALEGFIHRSEELLKNGDFSSIESLINSKKPEFTAELKQRKGRNFEVEEPYKKAWLIFKIETYLTKDTSKWTEEGAQGIGFENVNVAREVWNLYLEQTKLKSKKSLDAEATRILTAAEFFIQKFKEIRKEQSRNFQNELMQKFAALNPPAGVKEPKEAKWELHLLSLSEEERRKRYGASLWSVVASGFTESASEGTIPQFIAEFPERLREKEKELNAAMQVELAAYQWPYGIQSEADASRRTQTVEDVLNGIFLGVKATPEAIGLLDQISSLQSQEMAIEAEMKRVDEKMAQLENSRASAVTEFAKLVTLEMSYTDKSAISYSDPQVTKLEAQFWQTAEILTQVNAKLQKLQQEILRQHGTSQIVTAELTALEDEFLARRSQLETERRKLIRVKALAIFDGRYQSEGDKESRRAAELLTKLIGGKTAILTGEIDSSSIEGQLFALHAKREQLRHDLLEAKYEADSIRFKLASYLPKRGAYVAFEMVEWGNLISKTDYSQFLSWLTDNNLGEVRQRAFAEFLNQWESAWAREVISDKDHKRLDWYMVEHNNKDNRPVLLIK